MAGSIVYLAGSSSISVTSIISALDGSWAAKQNLYLAEMESSAVPTVIGYSDIGGSLYRFSTAEPISTSNVTSTAATTYYIELTSSSSQCAAEFSTTVPAFRSDYLAWYHSTSSVNRTVGMCYFDGTDYPSSQKYYIKSPGRDYFDGDIKVEDDITCDDLYCDDISCGLISASSNIVNNGYLESSMGRRITNKLAGTIYDQNDLFDALSSSIPNINDTIILSGAFYITNVNIVSYAIRHDSSTIYLYYCSSAAYGPYSVVNGSTTAFGVISVSW